MGRRHQSQSWQMRACFSRDELRMLVRIAFSQALDAVSKDRDLSFQFDSVTRDERDRWT